MMIKKEDIEHLSNKIINLIKDSPVDDLDKNLHALMQSALTKMGLVSREEFDVQTEVLRHANEKLSSCEEKLAELALLLKNK